jgi:hypothetical protein
MFCERCNHNPCECSIEVIREVLGGWEPCPCDCGRFVNGENMPGVFPILPCTYLQTAIVDVLHPADRGKTYLH